VVYGARPDEAATDAGEVAMRPAGERSERASSHWSDAPRRARGESREADARCAHTKVEQ
jgi:hypothetical protein